MVINSGESNKIIAGISKMINSSSQCKAALFRIIEILFGFSQKKLVELFLAIQNLAMFKMDFQ